MDFKSSMEVYLGVKWISKLLNSSISPHLSIKCPNKFLNGGNTTLVKLQSLYIIINSILIASMMNNLAVFSIPSYIANKIDNMLTRLFWTNNQEKGILWRKQSIIHCTKGLGIRNIEDLNEALLMKKARRILNKASLIADFPSLYDKIRFSRQSRCAR